MARVSKTMQLIDVIRGLKDPQIEAQSIYDEDNRPRFVNEAQSIFDGHLTSFVRKLVTGDVPGFGKLHMRVVSLPIKYVGLGIYTMGDAMNYCYRASCLQTQQLQGEILRKTDISGSCPAYTLPLDAFASVCGLDPSHDVEGAAPHHMSKLAALYFSFVMKDMPTHYHMTQRDLDLWRNNKIKHTQDYLMEIPVDGLGQRIGAWTFSTVLGYRLGVPLFVQDYPFPCCGDHMDVFWRPRDPLFARGWLKVSP